MSRQSKDAGASPKTELRDRIESFYEHFNRQEWKVCFETIDPLLRESQRIRLDNYSEALSSFFEKYGPIAIQSLKLSLHLDVKLNKADAREFANGVLAWHDRQGQSHVFKERWVRANDDNWYTRMIGLV